MLGVRVDRVDCPICGVPNTQRNREEGMPEGMSIIFCTNLDCASNGGKNASMFLSKMLWREPYRALCDLSQDVYQGNPELGTRICDQLTVLRLALTGSTAKPARCHMPEHDERGWQPK